MTKELGMASRGSSRLFVGIRPQTELQILLDNLCAQYKDILLPRPSAGIRWTNRLNRHLTLIFLGETINEKIPFIQLGLKKIATETGGFEGRITSLNLFPKSHSKILAAELECEAKLLKLHEDCKGLIENLGMVPEKLSYRPHITLARCRSGFFRFPPAVLDCPLWLGNITLYQSTPRAESSLYRPLYEATLAGARKIK
ncbi:RNA 2',3'-cyclic phosphodiesterase [Microbulbifer sp. GL-2]|uniref:RNA 2',3'-cyclic phosphodiesterase n=1 Tax=Microbulbifer sp. GL-2 TaxID=2591606 RepID=UPI0011808AE2|nr:RNA 2',3'-cyclic phosphodiesterase [Microbulbifer sp. GL-2]